MAHGRGCGGGRAPRSTGHILRAIRNPAGDNSLPVVGEGQLRPVGFFVHVRRGEGQ